MKEGWNIWKRRWQVGKCSFKDAKISDKLGANDMSGNIIASSIGNVSLESITLLYLLPKDIETLSKTWAETHPGLALLSLSLLLFMM